VSHISIEEGVWVGASVRGVAARETHTRSMSPKELELVKGEKNWDWKVRNPQAFQERSTYVLKRWKADHLTNERKGEEEYIVVGTKGSKLSKGEQNADSSLPLQGLF